MIAAVEEVVQFSCNFCGTVLTVPSHMAGISGPCPVCSKTITSPAAPGLAQVSAPPFQPPPQAPAAAPTPPAPSPLPSGPLLPPAASPLPPAPIPLAAAPSSLLGGPLIPSAAFPPAAANPPAAAAPPQSPWGAPQPAQASPLQAPPAQPQPEKPAPLPATPAAPTSPWAGNGFLSQENGAAHPVLSSLLNQPGILPAAPQNSAAMASAPVAPAPLPNAAALSASPQHSAALLPATAAPSAKQVAVKKRRSRSSSSSSKRGPLVVAILMLLMAAGGATWFFKDQVKLLVNRAMLHFKKTGTAVAVVNPAPVPSAKPGPPASFNPDAQTPKSLPRPKAGPSLPLPSLANIPAGPAKPETSSHSPPSGSAIPSVPASAPPVEASPPSANVFGGTAPAPQSSKTAVAPPVPTPAPSISSAPSLPPIPPPPVSSPKDPSSAGTAPSPLLPPLPAPAANPPREMARKALPVDGPESTPPTPPPGVVEVPSHSSEKQQGSSGDSHLFVSAPPDAQGAVDTLKKFFAASTWQERLPYSQAANKMKLLMERYYDGKQDGPIKVTRIELLRQDANPEVGSTPQCVFQVAGPSLEEPLPVMVEKAADGWKVDWLTFTEFKDKLLLHFLEKWQDNPGRFHVMLRRTHYFDDDVPDKDKKYCLEISPPMPGFSGFVFVPKGTPLAKELDRTVGWQVNNAAAIVELQWMRQDHYQWVEITTIPQYNWHTPGTDSPGSAPIKLNDDGVAPAPAAPSKSSSQGRSKKGG